MRPRIQNKRISIKVYPELLKELREIANRERSDLSKVIKRLMILGINEENERYNLTK
jgi:metal-responsive CopG/Arc/MetJ family transcriptional regulator